LPGGKGLFASGLTHRPCQTTSASLPRCARLGTQRGRFAHHWYIAGSGESHGSRRGPRFGAL